MAGKTVDARANPAGNLHSIMDCRGSASLGHRSRVTIPNTSGTFSPQMPPHAPSAWFFGVAWTCCSIKEARPVLFLIFHLVLRHLTWLRLPRAPDRGRSAPALLWPGSEPVGVGLAGVSGRPPPPTAMWIMRIWVPRLKMPGG